MAKKVGYARISVPHQNLMQQMQGLKQAGCKYIFSDKADGVRDHHRLQEALEYLERGDILVVYKLNILGYSIASLNEIISNLYKRGIGFKSIQDNIDTTEEHGEMIFHFFRSVAEYERDIIQTRTQVGLVKARARGKNGGRPKTLTAQQIETIKQLHADKTNSIASICRTFNISRPTLYAYLKK